MRRLALSSAALVCLFATTPALGSPTHSTALMSARYSMRIDYTGSSNPISVVGTGMIDETQRLSTFDFNDRVLGRRSVVISSWPNFSVFGHDGSGWQESFATDTSPFVDPGLALRLDARRGRVLGTELTDGVRTTKVVLSVRSPDAGLLDAATAVTRYDRVGIPVTLWIDGAGAVRRMVAVIKITSNNYLISKTVVDERLSAFGTRVHLTRPVVRPSAPVRANLVELALDVAVIGIESYYGDHRSYVGMTGRVLRDTEDFEFPPDVRIVRASATTYCDQATLNGVTSHQNGPKAPYAAGPC